MDFCPPQVTGSMKDNKLCMKIQKRTKRREKCLRFCLRLFIPRKINTIMIYIAGALALVLIPHAFLPQSDNLTGLPFVHQASYEVLSPNFSAKLASIIMPRRESRVDCAAIIRGNLIEIEKATRISAELETSEPLMTANMYRYLSQNCSIFRSSRGYVTIPLSQEELDFPIAFSILVYTDIEMAERLLRAIYQPQNYYCIHIDAKTDDVIHQAFLNIASCFPNVVIPSRRIDVVWGSFSVLEADLLCMSTLWPFKRWKYFINLTGQEFPLKSNSDLVKILKSLDGANDIHSTLSETYAQRWRYRNHPPPSWFQPVKGSVHICGSRAFVDYVLHNDTAFQVFKWVESLDLLQDEAFFSTLNHNPQLGVPGSYKGYPDANPNEKPFLSRYKVWNTSNDYFCYSQRWVRYICILTVGDLPVMARSVQLFANKFYLQEDRLVISCLEELLYNATRDNLLGIRHMDTSFYQNLDFVKNQVRVT